MQIRHFLLLPFFFWGLTHAQSPAQEAAEKAAAVAWIDDTTPKSVTRKQASQIVDKVYRESKRKKLDPMLVLSTIKAESNFRANATSSAGAQGLMQVLPKYHRDKLGKRSPTNPSVNIEVGTQILADCKDQHRGNMSRTMRCYSGGAGPRYLKRVVATRAAIRKYAQAKPAERQRLQTVAYLSPR